MAEEIDKSVSVRLKAIRLSKNVTAADLASEAEIPPKRLARIENGRAAMSLAEAVRAARALGVTTNNITGETPLSEAVSDGSA